MNTPKTDIPQIGPFFYVHGKLFFNMIPLAAGDSRVDKLDNPYGHDVLWNDHFSEGDYVDFPRGRVVWDCTNERAIIYIDPCINKPEVLEKIKEAFSLNDYVVRYEEHYHCKNCIGDIWEDW